MTNIIHEPGKWLVVWTAAILLIEGIEGRVTATRDSFDWFDTRDDAIAAIHLINPDWTPPDVDPLASEEDPLV